MDDADDLLHVVLLGVDEGLLLIDNRRIWKNGGKVGEDLRSEDGKVFFIWACEFLNVARSMVIGERRKNISFEGKKEKKIRKVAIQFQTVARWRKKSGADNNCAKKNQRIVKTGGEKEIQVIDIEFSTVAGSTVSGERQKLRELTREMIFRLSRVVIIFDHLCFPELEWERENCSNWEIRKRKSIEKRILTKKVRAAFPGFCEVGVKKGLGPFSTHQGLLFREGKKFRKPSKRILKTFWLKWGLQKLLFQQFSFPISLTLHVQLDHCRGRDGAEPVVCRADVDPGVSPRGRWEGQGIAANLALAAGHTALLKGRKSEYGRNMYD